jgi:hypothetical protein
VDELLRALRRAPGAAAFVAALLLTWSLVGLTLGVRRRVAGYRSRRRLDRALGLEQAACGVLAREGFRIVAAQVSRELLLDVDGALLPYVVKADYLVEDLQGDLFVAEVKTGPVATDPLHTATRRQLLEYQLGYADARGVLLVDMERGAVLRVRFAPPASDTA